ncbi:hypothetical protein BDV34DRAFT_107990 [Aspergillus parasiticus]|uniref:C2H2 transcription factor (Rpn4) n=3 Tax=Aspergillus subgen. Circumdati TaxID=2720871 RepID=A0A2G7FIV6_9EURO|nr:hypothetical protein BDV34DRAFT_107990 [Aspergillus parasiticus]KAB8223696.1 hypothetical protein BDV33DRAFT_30323 [Aspergillus novoparasiticus]KAE8335473.1 hypothetical protein BDV24DRAFT_155987 [Aspergillus arachidicola]PIG79711.1 C2H2 transcription factor (Rpn4) [Aspergillus arachidicola]
MSMYPSIRNKGFISEPTSTPFINFQDPVFIQDEFLPDLSQEAALQFYNQQLPRLQSPFQYHSGLEFYSPPSSAPSSPTSSPASSTTHLPATTAVAAEYPNSFEAPSMTPVSSYNSAFNIQHTATPPSSQPYLSQYPQYLFENSPMLAQQPVANTHGWENNLQLLSSARMQHKASPSTSSTRSAPAGSSYQRSNASTLSKPLPTPVQTPIQNSFLTAPYQQNYDTSVHDGSQAEAEMVRRAVMEQQQKQQQQQSHHQHQPNDYSLAPSVSSVSHNSPVTPQIKPEELDEASKAMVNGEKRYPDIDRWMDDYLHLDAFADYNNHNGNNLPIGIPKINRTMSDIYQDELYNPALMPTPQVSKQTTNQQNLLNPFRNVFADRLQAANQGHMTARSHSPVVNMHRDRSPFRQNSPLAAEYNNGFQQPQMATSVPMTQNVGQSQGGGEPKTMSPKDALLDFNEGDDAGIPLFPTSQPDFNLGEALGLRRESSSSFPQSQNFTSMESFPTQYTTPNGLSQQYPFAQQQQDHQQQQQNNLLHQTPEFPASLPHFESTNSDAGVNNGVASPPAQPTMAMRPVKEEITRPERTSADSGTYTCTYHGCTLRFETPTKLQKHKREAHRQTTPGGHLVGRDTSARNSQAGPHKCERINPSTGKPCNSVFSRPYDLTRHEDTIHNARKQKVRCHLCTEEKTFSRNDALTRHMRVVHPEVDWPGKQRRRGRE